MSPEPALVLVIRRMTTNAALRRFRGESTLTGMAGVAVQPSMGTGQPEIRLAVMVKFPVRPAIRVVAVGAGVPQPPVMKSILVTVRAFGCGLFERRRLVAAFAGNNGMQSNQRKRGDIVVENNLCTPSFCTVASSTTRTQLAFVNVVSFVTVCTGAARFLQRQFPGVAGVALQFSVFSDQGKIGVLPVIEPDLFPLGRFVAGFAFLSQATFVDILD